VEVGYCVIHDRNFCSNSSNAEDLHEHPGPKNGISYRSATYIPNLIQTTCTNVARTDKSSCEVMDGRSAQPAHSPSHSGPREILSALERRTASRGRDGPCEAAAPTLTPPDNALGRGPSITQRRRAATLPQRHMSTRTETWAALIWAVAQPMLWQCRRLAADAIVGGARRDAPPDPKGLRCASSLA
jgi:hypothetical protein